MHVNMVPMQNLTTNRSSLICYSEIQIAITGYFFIAYIIKEIKTNFPKMVYYETLAHK